uniref:Uncharacterized protein n=1 Tax=Anguilla anguilla TaxID=7936 RepID=A0A0E9XSV2_ANGAN
MHAMTCNIDMYIREIIIQLQSLHILNVDLPFFTVLHRIHTAMMKQYSGHFSLLMLCLMLALVEIKTDSQNPEGTSFPISTV